MSRKIILIALAAASVLLIMLQPASAVVIYPYTNINDPTLSAGTTLFLISDPNRIISIQGDGTNTYFDSNSFTNGVYTKSLGDSNSYYVTTPDATIQILRNGIAGAEIYGKTISSSEWLKIIVTPTNPDYMPYALSVKTDAGGTTTYFGNVDTKVGTPTGLHREGSTLVMETPVLKDAGITSGSFDIAALYDRSIFRSGIPDNYLTGTYYSEQHANTPTSTSTPKPTKTQVIITRTPTPTKTAVPTITQTETPTQEPTTSVPTATATASPIFPAAILAGLGIALAVMRRNQ